MLKRGIPNQAFFEAYVQYCFAPKHTVGEQLLDVRRDKRERAAFAVATGNCADGTEEDDEGEDGDRELDSQFGLELAEFDGANSGHDELNWDQS